MKNKKMKFLAELLKKSFFFSPWMAISVIVLVLIQKVLDVGIPLLMGQVIDSLPHAPRVSQNLLLLTLFWSGSSLFYPFQSYMTAKFVQTSMYRLSVMWMQDLFSKNFSFFADSRIGGTVNATNRGIAAAERYLSAMMDSLAPLVLELVLASIMILKIGGAWPITLIAGLCLVQIALGRILILKRSADIKQVNDIEDALAEDLIEKLGSGKIFKIERAIPFALKSIHQKLLRYAHSAIKVAVSGSMLNVLNSSLGQLGAIALIALLAGGHGPATVGVLTSLLMLNARFATAVSSLIQNVRTLHQYATEIDRFVEIMSEASDERDGVGIAKISSLQMKNLSLKNGSFHLQIEQFAVKPGEKIAVIGPSGSGKSTFIESLAGLQNQALSQLQINHVPLADISSQEHWRVIRYCPQKNFILSGALTEGVYFNDELPKHAASSLNRLGFTEKILSHQLTQDGQNVSGGEARRLALSRLFDGEGEIYIFDEPTSSLDEVSTQLVMNLIFDELKDKTVIVTTHDYKTLSRFDRICIMENGRMKQDGPAAQVLQGQNYRLLEAQQS